MSWSNGVKENTRTCVGVNVLTSVSAQAYSSHCQEWFRMGRNFPSDEFLFHTPHRNSIDKMRNESVKYALDTECDFLYFIDDDMILSPGTYKRLRDSMAILDADVVMAASVIRGYPYDMMCFKKTDEGGLTFYNDYKVDENNLLRCSAIGCTCVLFNTRIFKRLEPPYFVTGPNFTEDVYFCMKAEAALGADKLKIYTDFAVPTGHMLEPGVVTIDNRATLKKRDEEDNIRLKKTDDIDRGTEYANLVEAQFSNEA